VEIRITFREGGAYDYHTVFEQIKERLHHAVSVAREEGRNIGSTGVLNPADLANVDLEQLPAYEPASAVGRSSHAEEGDLMASSSTMAEGGGEGSRDSSSTTESTQKREEELFTPPNEPPPGYEEAQAQAISIDFDQRLREEARRL
jgi:WW domain-binding protein 2